jgi:hypothetical protein
MVFITEVESVYCAVRTGSLYIASLTFSNSTFCPQCIYVFCVDLRTNSDFYLYSINLLVFITEAESVYCTVRSGSSNQTDTVLSLGG